MAILAILGIILALVGGIWFLVVAFSESVLWGLGVLIVPLVGLVFLAMHAEKSWKPFALYAVGIVMIIAAGAANGHPPVAQP
jgi:hypothetical protein